MMTLNPASITEKCTTAHSIVLENDPVKLYIKDIRDRIKVSSDNKYVYNFADMYFKNIHIHGVVTEVFVNDSSLVHFEVSDPTGSIEVFFKSEKFQTRVSPTVISEISEELNCSRTSNNGTISPDNLETLSWMMNEIEDASKPFFVEQGDCVSAIGNVVIDEISNERNISAFTCSKTSLTADVIWLQELGFIHKTQYSDIPWQLPITNPQ